MSTSVTIVGGMKLVQKMTDSKQTQRYQERQRMVTDGQGGQLHAATRKGKVHVVKKLLKEGTRVDYPNSRDQTALFCACYLGKEKTVKLLLKYGANANERSDNGSTPVHAAAWSCKTGILLRLVRAGGNIRLHDNEGRTPKDWALERDKKKNKKMLILLDQMYMHAVALSNGEVTTGASGDSVMMYTGSGNNQPAGYISTIPIIPETQLSKVEAGSSAFKYVTGGFFTMQNRGILHCCVTSHAAYITCGNICKLGNFEYAVERCENQALQKKSLVLQNSRPLAAYNWLAPEIHAGRPPTIKSDIYSFCALIFEIYTGQVPFESLEAHDFRRHVATGKRLLQMEEGGVALGLDRLMNCGLSYRGVNRLSRLTSYREQLCRELEVSRCTYTVGSSPSCLGETTMDTTQDSMTDQDLVASLPDCLDGKDSIQYDRTNSMKQSPNRRLLPKQGSLSAFDTSDKENLPPFPPKFQSVLDNALHAVSNIREHNFTFRESPIHYQRAQNSQSFHEKSATSERDEGVVVFKRDRELKIYNNPEDIEIYDSHMPAEQHTHSTPIVTSRLHQMQQPFLKESPLQPHYEPSSSSSLLSKRWSFLARKSKSVGQLIQTFEAKAKRQNTKSNRASQSDLAAQDADPASYSVEREKMSTSAKEQKQMEATSSLNGSDDNGRFKVSPNVTGTVQRPDKDDSTNTISEANTTDLHWQSAIDGSADTVTEYHDMSKAEDSAVSLSLDGKESFYMEAQDQDSVVVSTMEAGSSAAPVEVHYWPQEVEKQQSPSDSNDKAAGMTTASTVEAGNAQTTDSGVPASLLDRQDFLDYRFRSLQECQAMDKMSYTTDSSFISSATEESSDSEGDSGSSTSKESLQLDPASHTLSKEGKNSHIVHHKLLQSLQERSAFEDDLTQISALEMSVTSLDQPNNGAKEESSSAHSDPVTREDEELTTEDQQGSVPMESSHLAKVQASLTSRSRNDSILSETSLEVSAITSSAALNYSTSISNTRGPDSESKDGSITSFSSLEVSSLTKALEEMVPVKSQLTNIGMLESPTVKAVEMSESSSDGSEQSEEDNWMLGDGDSCGADQSKKISKDTQSAASPEEDKKMEFTREVEAFGRGDSVESSNGVDSNHDEEHSPQMCARKKTRVETYV
uniref:Protein kinase domain-containing protein n=1 Tax=Branchiostoma floridae TaxID=7739 RepID=C3ZA80_BRAFL|eukprot:XP_002594657.1 hypothetical protein BRAFLDRAFT_107498 [Branchiostoma floridae]